MYNFVFWKILNNFRINTYNIYIKCVNKNKFYTLKNGHKNMKGKNDLHNKRHREKDALKIPQLDSPWSFYFIKFRCRLEIFLSFSKDIILLFYVINLIIFL